jgi:hypothetical protein
MTSAIFPARLQGYFEDDSRRFTLTEDFIYADTEKDIRVVVPKGFTTDWNSVPEPLWAYFAPWEYPEAGLVHDWLYASPAGFSSGALKPPLSKAQCDDIHRRILDLKGCRWTKRQAIWSMLRAFGGHAWNKHRAQDPPQVVVVVADDHK